MNITQVVGKTKLSAKTIRFYEEKSLITPPTRSKNGYRHYQHAHLEELTLLKQAREVGFTLKECRQLLELFRNPCRHSADIKAATLNKISEIEKTIMKLNVIRDSLLLLVASCPGDNNAKCSIIDHLVGHHVD
ncbi:MAG: Cu(I)-responsive transcriptional regulator [Candidatus Phlomobacter fragariae]